MSANYSIDSSDPSVTRPQPQAGARGPQVIDLGNGYSIVYPDPSAPYDYQIVSNKAAAATGDGGVSATSYYTQQQQNQRDAAQLAEQQRQYNETFGYNKARGDQVQQLDQELGRGNLDVSRGRLSLDQLKQQQDYYLRMSDIASNPRNFVQTFFLQRGVQPPGGSQQYGNGGNVGSYGPPTQMSQQMPQATTPMRQNVQPPVPTTGSPYNPATDPNRGTRFEGLSGFNTDGTLRLAPNDPDAVGLMAKHPGQYRVGFAHGGVTPEPIVGRGVISGKQYIIGENGPEGIVPADYLPKFLQSRHGQAMGGTPSADFLRAQQMGGVAATRRFGDATIGADPSANDYGFESLAAPGRSTRAYAVGGVLGFDAGDSYNPNPQLDPVDPYTSNDGYTVVPWNTSTPTPQDPSNPYAAAYDPYANVTTQTYGPQVPSGYGPTNPQQLPSYTQTPAPAGFHWQGGILVQDATTPVTPAPEAPHDQQIVPSTPPPLPPLRQPLTPDQPLTQTTNTAPLDTNMAPPGYEWDPTRKTYVKVQPIAPPVSTSGPFIQQPTGVPQGDGTVSAAPTAGALTPRDVSAAGTFGSISGARPTFLPGEDQGGSLQALLAANALPPFLSRLFAQDKGVASQGTNQPQRFALPSDVPLVSKLAFTQMSPSEQQALLSYASSYGVTPEDYLAAIEQFAPQGGEAQSPLFGNQFRFSRQ